MLNGMRMGQPMRCYPQVGPPGSPMGPPLRMGGPEAGAPQAEGPAVAASAWVPRQAPLLVMTDSQVRHWPSCSSATALAACRRSPGPREAGCFVRGSQSYRMA